MRAKDQACACACVTPEAVPSESDGDLESKRRTAPFECLARAIWGAFQENGAFQNFVVVFLPSQGGMAAGTRISNQGRPVLWPA